MNKETIQKRAYELWQEKGRDALTNWLQAERELSGHPHALETFEVVPAMFLPNGKNKPNTA